MPPFRSLDNADVKGKRVLVRVDLNVPMQDGKVADSTRIEEIVATIAELADKGGKIILLSHFDRPKGRDPKYSLRPVAAEVARSSSGRLPSPTIASGRKRKPPSPPSRMATLFAWKTPASIRARKRTTRN